MPLSIGRRLWDADRALFGNQKRRVTDYPKLLQSTPLYRGASSYISVRRKFWGFFLRVDCSNHFSKSDRFFTRFSHL